MSICFESRVNSVACAFFILGGYKACEIISDLTTWANSWLPSSTISKTNITANHTLEDYSNVAGLWDATQSCPWPLTTGSYSCYSAGFHKNPVGHTFSLITAPIRIIRNTEFCFVNERGFMNQAACVFGLDENTKNDLEEKIQIIAGIVLLIGLWYLTIPKKTKKNDETIFL